MKTTKKRGGFFNSGSRRLKNLRKKNLEEYLYQMEKYHRKK